MPSPALIAEHRKVQHAAKEVLVELTEEIGPDDTEQSIVMRAESAMRRHGIGETWYHDCPALVLLGSRSCASPSGRDYQPSSERVGQTNLVTVDLSPVRNGYWGDCARSFFIENGRVTCTPTLPDLAAGAAFLPQLHSAMQVFAQPRTTFHELAMWTAEQLEAAGFLNLDSRKNFGHSIATRREDRLYIKEGNPVALGEVDFFTFEPHVCAVGGRWGFKHEDIFFFDARGDIEEL